MTPAKMAEAIREGRCKTMMEQLYAADLPRQETRICEALDAFSGQFGGDRPVRLFSAPGRTEIGGNHTDHQRGRVMAAAVDLDILCVASPNEDGMVRIQSAGYPMDEVPVGDTEPKEGEKNKAVSLIRGILARCKALGYRVSGFDAYTTSNVLKGSGLSSSAAFEVAIGTMVSHLFNEGAISAVEVAQIGQYAENEYFGKPSGLMDQMASSVGGFVLIDFENPDKPVITPVAFDPAKAGYRLVIVDTGGNHADLTPEYAAIPVEMKKVAEFFGAEFLREVDPEQFFLRLPEVRQACGDRAAVRAYHFFGDNDRVVRQAERLREGDFPGFLQLLIDSGRSSQCYLQNVFASSAPREQGLSVALALSERLLGPGGGGWRVHGGGFAGTIQAFVPDALLDDYLTRMRAVFGSDSCYQLSIRPLGGVEIR